MHNIGMSFTCMSDGYHNRIPIRSHTDRRKPAAENEEKNGMWLSSTTNGLGYSCVTITPNDEHISCISSGAQHSLSLNLVMHAYILHRSVHALVILYSYFQYRFYKANPLLL